MNLNGEMPLPLIASLGAAGILIGAGKTKWQPGTLK